MTFLGSGIPVPKSLFATDGGTVQAEPQVQTSYICRRRRSQLHLQRGENVTSGKPMCLIRPSLIVFFKQSSEFIGLIVFSPRHSPLLRPSFIGFFLHNSIISKADRQGSGSTLRIEAKFGNDFFWEEISICSKRS